MASAASHIGVCVTDMDKARRFYEGVFGFRSAFGFATDDPMTAQLLRLTPPAALNADYLWLDGLLLELITFDTTAPRQPRVVNEPGLTHLSFFVEDLEATVAAVEQLGGAVRADTNVGVAVFVEDPDGQMIELVGPDGRFRDMRDRAVGALDA
jgi:catechol 2,3-dioxygenase-like lactoylglutathione lyase family enzyme